jgi:tetratricopeptide (TPR) repeat protein
MSETRHRPTAGVGAVIDALDQRLENETEVLDAFLLALARNQLPKEAWNKLHEAAKRDDRVTELAFAFEGLAGDRKLRTLQAGVVAEFMLQSSIFFGDVMGDDVGAATFLDKAMAAMPTHMGAIARFEDKLTKAGEFNKLGDFYFEMAAHRARADQAPMLRKAIEAYERVGGERLADALTMLVRVDPKDDEARGKLENALLSAGRPKDVAKMLEQALTGDPPLPPEEQFAHRTKLLALYDETNEVERAIGHVEWLLGRAPGHEGARSVGIRLLEVKSCAGRAASALAQAAEKSEAWADAVRFYTLELDTTRGAKRFGPLRALAALRHDRVDDLPGAYEAAEQALQIDASDNDLLDRFVALTRALGKHDAAQKTLQRLVSVVKDPSARARLAAEMGELLLATGDVKRARAAFSSALSTPGASELAVLPAMHALARLYGEDEDHVSLAEMLERIVRTEPDVVRRQQAAEQLAELASGALGDPARAVSAYRGLLDTPARAKALDALEPLLGSIGDAIGLAEILRVKAADAATPEEKRALLFRAAEQLTEASGNHEAASQAWRAIVAEFGPTKDVLQRWIPLLELERDFATLAQTYESLAKLLSGGEKVETLARLGLLRMQWLGDARAAIDAFREALAIDPHEKMSREAMEQLLDSNDPALAGAAADVLEPMLRAEGSRGGLLRVLLARAHGSPDPDERTRALEGAVSLAEHLPAERGRVLGLVRTALAQALEESRPVAPWLGALDRLAPGEGGAGARADVLALALGDRAVSTNELLAVAQALGDSALLAGDRSRALEAYKRALDFAPSSPELMAAVDLLLRDQGTPHDRVRLYRAALAKEANPDKRRSLHLAIASLQRKDLGDGGGAIETLRASIAEGPDDATEDALYDLYCEAGAFADACTILEQRLPRTSPGEDERALRARLAKLASERGLKERAVVHAKALAEDAFATNADLDLVEQVAERADDPSLLAVAAGKRVELAESGEDKVFWYTRLGTLHHERGDAAGAAAAWRDGASAAEQMGDRKTARKLYERIRRGSPFDRTATERLASLVETSGDWSSLPELYAALVESAGTGGERKDALLKLADVLKTRMNDATGAFDAAARAFLETPEDATVLERLVELGLAANAAQTLGRTLDTALGSDAGRDPTVRARIVAAKADVIANDESHADEARDLYRAVLDDPHSDEATKARAADRFEALLGRASPKKERDAWRWLLSWRVGRESGPGRAAALGRFARLEEEKLEDAGRAIELWKQAAEVDPQNAEAPAEIARLMIATGDIEGALGTLRARLANAEGEAASRLRAEVAGLLASIPGREGDAMNEIRAALSQRPDDEAALRLLVKLLPHAEIGPEASRLLEASLESADGAAKKRVLQALVSGAVEAPVDRRRGWHGQLLDLATSQDESYSVLLRALAELPVELPWWDRAEQLARALDRPQELSDLYQASIGKDISVEDAIEIGQRAVAFHEEWFDDAAAVVRILERMVDLDPAGWAFDRLKLLYDSQERWDELFALYDRILAGKLDDSRRTELLEDAAQIAKDFAKNADRAIGYLEQLLHYKPKNERLLASLERLYERHGKYRDLIGLLGAQLGGKSATDAHALRSRMSALWLDELGDAGAALLVIEEMMQEGQSGDDVIALLERVLSAAPTGEEMKKTLPPTGSAVSERVASAHDSMPPPRASVPPPATGGGKRGNKRVLVRQRAASLLRERYAELEREADLARMLEVELEAVKNAKERIRRHGEVATLHEKLGNDAAALEHAVSLVMLDPDSNAHRERLARLADKSGKFDRLAEVLAAAADDCEGDDLRATLLVDSAVVYSERLGDAPRAIDLLGRVLHLDVSSQHQLAAARRLDALLAAADRKGDRLSVLERLATLEEEKPAKREALGEAARLAGLIGENDRSVAAWRARLEDDAHDIEALNGLVEILSASGKVRALVDALLERANVKDDAVASREDRVRAARILSSELDARSEAIAVWELVRKTTGDTDDVDAALAELLEKEERWKDLAELLERGAARHDEPETKAQLLARLGDVNRAKLDEPKRAIDSYSRALEAKPADAQAIAGLTALLDVRDAAREALDVVLRDHSKNDAWAAIVALLPQRLRLASSDEERVANLLETSDFFEKRANDLEAAFHAAREAFTIARGEKSVADTAERLAHEAAVAGAPDAYRAFAEAHRTVLEALEGSRTASDADVLRLRTKLGELLEVRLDDARGALVQFTRVAQDEPSNEQAALSLIRVAGRVGRWDAAAKIVLDRAAIAGGPDETLLHALEDAASAHAGWDALTTAFEAAIGQHGDLAREAARDLEARLATWHRDRRGDAEAAEAAYSRALQHDPNDTRLLSQLAQLQRRHKGRPLIDSLLRLSQATGGDPELLREAAEVAARVVVDRALAKNILDRLLKLASERWTSSEEHPPSTASPSDPPSVGPTTHPSEHVEWALAELLRVHNEEGDAERIVELLEESAKLPFTRERSRELLHEAARTAIDRVGDAKAAQRLYARLFEDDPRDDEAARRLAEVYGSLGRKEDLLAVRKKQISVATDARVRVGHRLDAALLERELGRIDDATTSLRENLVDAPRHAKTTLVLSETLENAGRWDELSAFCAEQAGLAEADGDALSAVELWSRAASIAEEKLGHRALALAHYKRALALEVRAPLLDSIARIHEQQKEWTDAAANLDRLVREFPEQRSAVIVRLADAHSNAGGDAAAQERLEAALNDPTSPPEIAMRLAAIYGRTSQFAPLGELIARQAEGKSDAERRGVLVEAAEIFLTKCNAPERAVPLLEQASTLAPDDRALKLRLGEALQLAGQPDRARALLRDMIDAFAGRRPKERATVHFHLARLHLRIGERAQALAELEAATRIDPANPEILRMVAELARDDGQLDKAERSYRALLAVVRRADDDAPVLRTEVLVELSALAERQGEPDRAAEIIESAFETAASSDAEAKRLEKALRARGNTQGLLRSLRARLDRAAPGDARAEVLGELARSYEELGNADEALGMQLDAVRQVPTSTQAHDAAMALASKLGKTEAYIDAIDALAKDAQKSGDARAACTLMLRAADALTRTDGGATRAADVLERAKETGALNAEVLRALDRVYATLGEAQKQETVLSELATLEVESTSRDPRTASDILYRLADLRARRDEAVDDAARSLQTALDLSPDAERAATIADRAIARGKATPAMLDVFVKAARLTGRPELVQRAVLLQADDEKATKETLREAAQITLQAGDQARAESFLRRVLPLAEGQAEVLRWALLELAAIASARGDIEPALELELQAGDHCDPEGARRLREGVALRARQAGNVQLELLARRKLALADPTDATARAGLLELLRTTGDGDTLVEVIEALLPSVAEEAEKRELRRERARVLSAKPERRDEVMHELRALLEEEPYDAHAVALLAELLEASGDTGELSALLERQLDAAKDRQDGPGVAVLSLRLGTLVESNDAHRARELFTQGLDWDAKNRPLLQAMLRLLASADPGERADVMERLLETEQGQGAEQLALEIVGIRAEQWDDAGVERALEAGLAAHPASDELRKRLIGIYEDRGDRRKLAALKETSARAMTGAVAKAELLAAAALYGEIGEADAAARTLRSAHEIDPTDRAVLDALVQSLERRGDEAAATELGALAASSNDPTVLASRARVLVGLGRNDEAIADAERVHQADANLGRDLLLAVLSRAADSAEPSAQKTLRRRVADLYASANRIDEAHAQLEQLLTLDESDTQTLAAMAQLEETAGRFDTASDTYVRLLEFEEGDRFVETALKLADAATKAQNPGYAKDGLEKAHAIAPGDARVVEKLAANYAAIGLHKELAELRLAEARAATDPARRFEMLVAAGGALLEHDPAAAAAALEEARAIKPADMECAGLLGDAHIAAGRYDEARELLQACITAQKGRRSKDLAQIYLRLGRLETALTNSKGAMQAFTTALDMDGQNGIIASELAHVALAEGELDLATRALRAITMLRTPAPISKGIAYERLGEIAMHQGDQKKAVMLLKRAIDEDAELEHARELLAQLGG